MMTTLKTLDDLLHEHLSDLYDAETQILDALPLMAKQATAPVLRAAFEKHLEETKVQRATLDDIFADLGKKPADHRCKAMEGILREGQDFMKEKADPEVMDAGLIAAAQRVEHYEMAGYGCVRTWAKQLGMNSIAERLQKILDQEGETDHNLTKIAEKTINRRAVGE
ncbi:MULTISPECIES: ferritin-like domain-containing protein [Herpetosiphon]|uniref:YciE/YciF ferroxidase family protein n=1 Tax=Herpetosiphon TaxID=64 RepID=UPI00195C5260|nr:ferritin-like domain-containing protein [Herpetosiphon giganteus]MBM7844915.1 ferritin-like metal-binding protein YciE [Herpetosiphon giganteus]